MNAFGTVLGQDFLHNVPEMLSQIEVQLEHLSHDLIVENNRIAEQMQKMCDLEMKKQDTLEALLRELIAQRKPN